MSDTDSSWGCAAVGRSGSVAVDVNETVTGPTRWELQLDFPEFQLCFAIPSRDTVFSLHDFLTTADSSELMIGNISTTPISILRDDEFGDRFFMVAAGDDGALRWTIASATLADLIAALADAVSDLND